MLIHQASEETGLTRKAIEYYTQQGLVSPSVQDNGYRDYTEKEIERLRKIQVLRKLDLGTEEIRAILADATGAALRAVSIRKELAHRRDAAKKAILEALRCGSSYEEVRESLRALDQSKTITEKLLEAFPGSYGRFVCLHFARFLNEPVRSGEQQAAFEEVRSFLDHVPPFALPPELEAYLEEGTAQIGTEQTAELLERARHSMENPDAFLMDNREFLEWYLAYKQSDAYRESPACKLTAFLREFQRSSGYNTVFIPAMRRLSDSYASYYRQMETANEKLLARYPALREEGEPKCTKKLVDT
ncbi:MerR family transcriptional regulator [Clostridium sp. D33t1_170424_F3]|uniref:MerR family transcriptional regulator n=1 Tax=Clostridium sp. D33t1_170424_F3 TaxID=2787099 RepID=UPI0018A93AA8|nr:MerR family transcriptional regulator [Clostridium sp. D33t1_170424_F3]